jgi:hypothetical protein
LNAVYCSFRFIKILSRTCRPCKSLNVSSSSRFVFFLRRSLFFVQRSMFVDVLCLTSMFDVLCLTFCVCPLAFYTWCSKFDVQHSTFDVQHSMFKIQRLILNCQKILLEMTSLRCKPDESIPAIFDNLLPCISQLKQSNFFPPNSNFFMHLRIFYYFLMIL